MEIKGKRLDKSVADIPIVVSVDVEVLEVVDAMPIVIWVVVEPRDGGNGEYPNADGCGCHHQSSHPPKPTSLASTNIC